MILVLRRPGWLKGLGRPALFLLLVLTSCGPAAKLRRAERLIAKAEAQGAKWHVDSVITEIKVPVPQIQTDTVVQVKQGDSVVVEKERLKVIVKRLPNDTITIWAESRADTIRTKVTTTVTKTIKAKSWLKWWYLLIAAGVGLLVGFLRR